MDSVPPPAFRPSLSTLHSSLKKTIGYRKSTKVLGHPGQRSGESQVDVVERWQEWHETRPFTDVSAAGGIRPGVHVGLMGITIGTVRLVYRSSHFLGSAHDLGFFAFGISKAYHHTLG